MLGCRDTQPLLGEIVHAAVVLTPDSPATADELIAHCKSTLAHYKCPRAVTFLDALPKTAVGKISKKEIQGLIA